MNEPTQHPIPWDTLPEWAQWAAMDKDGQWNGYRHCPEYSRIFSDMWTNRNPKKGEIGYQMFHASPFPGDWRDSLQQRPAKTEPEPTREQLLAENRRLREALGNLVEPCMDLNRDTEDWTTFHEALSAARAALASAPTQPEATCH